MGKVGKVLDTIGKWIVLTPAMGLVIGGLWMLTAPGSDLSRRALAERFHTIHSDSLDARARGRALSFQAFLACPDQLPAATQIAVEQAGFRSVECNGLRGIKRYNLPFPVSPWFYVTLAAGAIAFLRARHARAAAAPPTPPA